MYLILIFQTETSRYPLGQQTYSRRFAGSTWCYPGVNVADIILCTMRSCSINVCCDAGRLVFGWALPSERVRPRRVLRAGAGQAWRSGEKNTSVFAMRGSLAKTKNFGVGRLYLQETMHIPRTIQMIKTIVWLFAGRTDPLRN